MAERPIIFSAPMVRAILAERKTQTRRILKPVTGATTADVEWSNNPSGIGQIGRLPLDKMRPTRFSVGDLLWVRESWTARMTGGWTIADARSRMYRQEIIYRADGVESIDGWWPSIHMPREFSRVTLKVTGVKVERLQDISEEDAKAEGVKEQAGQFAGCYTIEGAISGTTATACFQRLWESINGPGSWDANPWVAAISFERVPSSHTGEGR